MALDPSDVFVLQRATDTQPQFKLSLGELSSYIEASDTVQFRGARDFTNGAEDPNADGTGRQNGDMYVNDGGGTDIANGWADMTGTVSTGDRAIWDGNLSKWELIQSTVDSGGIVVELRKTDSITVDNLDDPTRPIVGIREATKGSDAAVNSGAVARLATDGEVATNGLGGTDAVVTADQLRSTNIDVEAALAAGVPPGVEVNDILIWSGTQWARSDVADGGTQFLSVNEYDYPDP